MIYSTLFLFCKLMIGFVFAISAISKLRDFTQFVEAIHGFRLLPSPLVKMSAILFVLCEAIVLPLLFIWPWWAFVLAAGLLTIFSAALALVILRKMETRCNCFGASQQTISPADLVRNGCFLACGLCGLWLTTRAEIAEPIMPLNAGIASFAALVFVLIGMQASEIYQLFQPQLHLNHSYISTTKTKR